MFAKILGKRQPSRSVETTDLAALAPYRDLDEAAIAGWARQAKIRRVEPGPLEAALLDKHEVFVDTGHLQINCNNGDRIGIRGDTPAASFPLPRGAQIDGITAVKASDLILVPWRPVRRPALQPALPDGIDPTDEERTALENLHEHFASKRCELPALPDLALKIGKAIDDPKNANEDIARLIQVDPALSARIIGVVNSAAFGGVSKITSIQQATARLGRHKVRGIVYSCLLKSIFRINIDALKHRMEQLWQTSAHVAALSYVLGRATPGIDPEQALLAGLVHDIGTVAAIGGINHFPKLAERPAVLESAIQVLRVEAALQTLKSWNLYDEFAEVVTHIDDWYRPGSAIADNTDIILLARLHAAIGKPHNTPLPPIDSIPAFAKLAEGQLSPRRSLAMLEEADTEVNSILAVLDGA